MPNIMISYRREDSGVITGRIFDRLVARYGREAIFRDIDNIPLGVDFRAHVDQVLGASDLVLAVVGPRWAGAADATERINDKADPVRVEIEAALRKGAPVIPVLVLDAAMPNAQQLPEGLREFAYRNALRLDAGQDFDVHMARLLRAVDRVLGFPDAAEDGRSAVPAPPIRKTSLRFGAATATVIVVLAVAFYLGISLQKPQPPPVASAARPLSLPAPPPAAAPAKASSAADGLTAPSRLDPELIFWQTIANSSTPADFSEYLRIYPQGQFAGLARNRLAMLHPAAPSSPSQPPPKPAAAKESPPQAPTTLPPPSADGGEMSWSVEEKREIQRALHALGHFRGEADGGFGPGTRAAIAEFRAFAGSAATGSMTSGERKLLLKMTQRLAVLLDQPTVSPQGVAATTIKDNLQRYARAWTLENGKGTKPDAAEAAYWYALAAAGGEARAFTNLGTLIARGQMAGSEPDPLAAQILWWAAAARGEPYAMFDLGELYERGVGVAADPARARAWYQRAADHHHPGAREAMKRLGA